MKKRLFSVATSAMFAATLASTALANGNLNPKDLSPDGPRVPEMNEIIAPENPRPSKPVVPFKPNPAAPQDLGTPSFPLPQFGGGGGGGGGGDDGHIRPTPVDIPNRSGDDDPNEAS